MHFLYRRREFVSLFGGVAAASNGEIILSPPTVVQTWLDLMLADELIE
jgi:hypothetical protein